MFNATFNKISVISWRSVLLVEETAAPGENHWPAASHWQSWSHNIVSSTSRHERARTHNFSGDRHWFHRIKTKTAPCRTSITDLQPMKHVLMINIQYWSVDGKYRIYLTRLRNGVKDQLLASLSPRFAPSQINSIFTVNRPILYLSCNPRCRKKSS